MIKFPCKKGKKILKDRFKKIKNFKSSKAFMKILKKLISHLIIKIIFKNIIKKKLIKANI